MKESVYLDCLDKWKKSTGNQPFWGELADKYGYPSIDSIRSSFKRERKRRGVEKSSGHVIDISRLPRVAIMDIETLFVVAATFGIYDQNIAPSSIIQDNCMLSWAGKYLFSDTIYSDILTPKEAVRRDTERITQSAWDFVDGADIVVGHNFEEFDWKFLQTEFLTHSHVPLKPRIVDTLKAVRKQFRFTSNKLEFINRKLGLRNKNTNSGIDLWMRCNLGEQEALDEMLEYNEGDILSTEELFWKIDSYIPGMPNFSLYNNDTEMSCDCGSRDIKLERGYWYTQTQKYRKYRCNSCGTLLRERTGLLTKEKKKSILARL